MRKNCTVYCISGDGQIRVIKEGGEFCLDTLGDHGIWVTIKSFKTKIEALNAFVRELK